MDTFFNISVYRALLNFKDRDIQSYEHLSRYITIEKQLNFNSNLDDAESIIIDFGFKIFNDHKFIKENKLLILYNLINTLKPPWLNELKKGRESFFEFLNEENEIDLLQLFEFCELDSNNLKSVSVWWKLFFQENYENFNKVLSGIEGEDKSKKYEYKMLRKFNIDKDLIDASIDKPDAGYDLISWRKSLIGETYKIYIESKNNEIIITRNEYLTSQKYKDKYFIYFWTNDNYDKPKKILDFDFISKYAPKDTTKSTWSTARLIVD